MKAIVLYDSFFGNSERIARAIASGLGPAPEVRCLRLSDLQPANLQDAAVLVVGSPKRGLSASPGTKAWLKGPRLRSLAGVKVAAFDTRINPEVVGYRIITGMVKLFGFAAEPFGEALAKQGGARAVAPEGFVVLDSEGPLKEGELERAEAWGRRIVAAA